MKLFTRIMTVVLSVLIISTSVKPSYAMSPLCRAIVGGVCIVGGVAMMIYGGNDVKYKDSVYRDEEYYDILVHPGGTATITIKTQSVLVSGPKYRRRSDFLIYSGFAVFATGLGLTASVDKDTIYIKKDVLRFG